MNFISVQDLPEELDQVWKMLEDGEDIVITRDGKPFAVLIRTQPQDIETMLQAIRTERFAATMRKMQQQAVERGLDKMTMEEIDAEIAAARKERQEHDASPARSP